MAVKLKDRYFILEWDEGKLCHPMKVTWGGREEVFDTRGYETHEAAEKALMDKVESGREFLNIGIFKLSST